MTHEVQIERLPARVYLIGAGPGDPDYLTMKGLRILERADVVLYTDSLVQESVVARAGAHAEIYKSAGMHLDEMVDLMVGAVRQGKSVARVHTGDPTVFGAILEQVARLKEEGVDCEIIPGVSSVFAAAAALGSELTVPHLTQTVMLTRMGGRTPMPEREQLRDLGAHQTTIVLYLSARLAKKAVEELLQAGWSPDTPAAAVYKVTWPDEKVIRSTLTGLTEAMREAGIYRHALLLFGWALDPALQENPGAYASKLYDKAFTHSYRRGDPHGGHR